MNKIPHYRYGTILVFLLVTLIAVAGCTGYGSSPASPATTAGTPAPASAPGTASVDIRNFAFSPATITVAKGTTVTWTNQDPATHQILNDAAGSVVEGAVFSSDPLQKGAVYSFRFDTPGTYTYHCAIHPSMKGTVVIT